MDVAESGLIWKSFIKRRGAKISNEFRSPPI